MVDSLTSLEGILSY